MKKILVLGLAVSLFYVSAGAAAVLQSAGAVPPGKFIMHGFGILEKDALKGSLLDEVDSTVYGPIITYGITERLSASAAYVVGSYSGDILSTLGLEMSMSGYLLGLNYCILNEQLDDSPLSLKACSYYSSANQKTDTPAGAGPSSEISAWDGSLILSKAFIPFVPYAGLKYASQSVNSSHTAVTELIFGSGLFLHPNFGILAEYASKIKKPDGASDTSNYEFGLMFAYLI